MSETNGYATKADILKMAERREYKDVHSDEYGTFTVRTLSDLDKSTYDAAAINKDGKFNRHAAINANARLVQLGTVDRADSFNPLFSVNDVPEIQKLPSAFVTWLADEIRDFNGLNDAEDAAKN